MVIRGISKLQSKFFIGHTLVLIGIGLLDRQKQRSTLRLIADCIWLYLDKHKAIELCVLCKLEIVNDA